MSSDPAHQHKSSKKDVESPQIGFECLSLFHSIAGFAMFEKSVVKELKAKFPLYEPTPREVIFGTNLIKWKSEKTLQGLVVGFGLGSLLFGIKAVRKRSIPIKVLLLSGLGLIGSSAGANYAIVRAFDKWITFDRVAEFNSWDDTYKVQK